MIIVSPLLQYRKISCHYVFPLHSCCGKVSNQHAILLPSYYYKFSCNSVFSLPLCYFLHITRNLATILSFPFLCYRKVSAHDVFSPLHYQKLSYHCVLTLPLYYVISFLLSGKRDKKQREIKRCGRLHRRSQYSPTTDAPTTLSKQGAHWLLILT